MTPINKVEDSYQLENKCRASSAFGQEKDHCLCRVLKPLIWLCQIYGILPVSHDYSNCRMSHSWLSAPVLCNFCWSIANVLAILVAAVSVRMFVDNMFASEIDFLAFGLAMAIQFLSTTLIFIFGNYTAIHFPKAWEILHSASGEIAMKNFQRMKNLIYLVPLYMIQDFVLNITIHAWMGQVNKMDMGTITVMVPLVTILSNVVPNLISSIYGVLLGIARRNFKSINESLEVLLQCDVNSVSNIEKEKIARNLRRYKMLHEKLCDSVRSLENAFGFQILIVIAGTGISFVIGVYGIIVGTQTNDTNEINEIGIGYGVTCIMAAGRILLIIYSCQALMEEANGTVNVLNRFDARDFSEATKVEVGKFLQKVGKFPIQTKCCNIFQLGNNFLASAATNVVTYVLILIQFRLNRSDRHIPPQVDANSLNQTSEF